MAGRLTHSQAMHRGADGGPLDADDVLIDDVANNFAATNVEDALAELAGSVGGGAPDTADYLVGTAQGGLSAEIVVGTTPQGELGGTWGSPTVDTTHAGSSHASVQSAAEATAAGALAAHAAAGDPHAGYLKEGDFDDIDFLVGTATGFTAAEIVVGTTPGGELGGTWASPTVDATHSGSTHAATQAAAEATAAAALTGHTGDTSDAHDASAVSFVPAGTVAATDVQAAIEEVMTESAAADSAIFAEVLALEDVTFLVGAATTHLTSEIVVGATPGGELGGTWAAPTVDATHSGSAHVALGSTPSTQALGDAAAGGADATASKNDHKHAMPSAATVATAVQSLIKLDDLAAPDDNTDLNVSITKHGLTPKAPNDATKFLDGTGAYSVPPGTAGAGGVPIGGGFVWFVAAPPTGHLICDGSSLLRAGTYAALFAVIGTDYGAADGTHFNLPDFQGRYAFGKAAAGTGSTLAGTFGAVDHTHTAAAHTHTTPTHAHTLSAHTHTMGNHTHDGPSHAHGMSNHVHAGPSHSHNMSAMAAGGTRAIATGTTSASSTGHTHAFTTTSDGTGDTGAPSIGNTANGGVAPSSAPSTNVTAAPSSDTTDTSGSGTSGSTTPSASGTGNPPSLTVNYVIRYV